MEPIQTTDTSTPPAAAGDGLEQLALRAEGLQTEGGDAAPGEAPPAPKLTNAQCITGVLGFVRDTAAAFGIQSPKAIVSDETAAALGEVWGAVADKHGIDLAKLGGEFGVEIAAVVATLPIGYALYIGVTGELAARKGKKELPAGNQARIAPAPAAAANAAGYQDGVIPPASWQ